MEGGSLIKCVFDVNKLISERPAKLSYLAALSPTSKGKLSSSPELVTISNPLIRQKKVTCNDAVFNFFYVYGQVYICKINFKLIEMHIYRIIYILFQFILYFVLVLVVLFTVFLPFHVSAGDDRFEECGHGARRILIQNINISEDDLISLWFWGICGGSGKRRYRLANFYTEAFPPVIIRYVDRWHYSRATGTHLLWEII